MTTALTTHKEINKIINFRLSIVAIICFLTAGEMYYGAYTDIFQTLDAQCFIRKPIENEELLKRLNKIMSST